MAATKPLGGHLNRQSGGETSFQSAGIIHDLSFGGEEGLHFVVSTSVEKPNPELRKLIRSHVMMGKNRGKKFPPQKRGSKRMQKGPPTSTIPASHPILPVTTPRKFGSDVSTISFADAVEPATVEVVLKCELFPPSVSDIRTAHPNDKPVSSIAKQVLFPLEICILFERRAESWIAPLTVDPAYLHAMIFTSQYYFDAMLTRKSSSVNHRTLLHYLRTLNILQERFAHDDDQARLSNTTVAAIMGIAGYAHITCDSKSAKHHMDGLSKIVNLRGGMISFKNHAKLLVEILRYDSLVVRGTSWREKALTVIGVI
jgi:hypothetical protein